MMKKRKPLKISTLTSSLSKRMKKKEKSRTIQLKRSTIKRKKKTMKVK
jgi:hypothetical protein